MHRRPSLAARLAPAVGLMLLAGGYYSCPAEAPKPESPAADRLPTPVVTCLTEPTVTAGRSAGAGDPTPVREAGGRQLARAAAPDDAPAQADVKPAIDPIGPPERAALPSIALAPSAGPVTGPATIQLIPPPDMELPAKELKKTGSDTSPLPSALIRPKDDGVVSVGGVPIPLPSDVAVPDRVRPTGAALPPLPPMPAGPLTAEPPIRAADAPRMLPPITDLQPVPPGAAVPPTPPAQLPLPSQLPQAPGQLPAIPTIPLMPGEIVPGPIDVGGTPLPFEALSQLVDGGTLGTAGGCSTCGGSCAGGQCAAGHKPCEPFPARTSIGRVIGLVYENICCPNPCYQPRWEPITAAAFFADAPRPVTQTRFRWDYGSNLSFPDRGEMFIARANGSGRGPKPIAPALGIGSLAYHELYLDQEIAAGPASVTISVPYRSINPYPDAASAAGFTDMQITAKSLLFDTELFMFAFQMRTYIPTGIASKGLGTGHTSLEPSLIAGIRVSQDTYALAQVGEWIPLGGDATEAGAALRYNFSFNHVLWRPVKDVQLIGTWEMTGLSFQDGAYTDPYNGIAQKLSGQTSIAMGAGARLYFCDKFDMGAGWDHQIAGQFLPLNQLRVEFRYRY